MRKKEISVDVSKKLRLVEISKRCEKEKGLRQRETAYRRVVEIKTKNRTSNKTFCQCVNDILSLNISLNNYLIIPKYIPYYYKRKNFG